ncbi:MAG: GNAT family N-acetyltransferase [Enterobacteriaceae bacterium]|jgi:RimJ/RimL family protein N-acetyltransferase|nr:GNAT family N-acetyltransferase [Enterobacteriaceae bacterium]
MPFEDLETQRLLLKRLATDDAAHIQQKFPHWEIVKYLDSNAVPWPYPANGGENFVNNVALPAIQNQKAYVWSLRIKTNPDEFIGVIGLYTKPDNNRGFWLSLEYQGQGLMREACERVTGYWFNELGQTVLRVAKASVNDKSRRISLAEGMKVIRTEKKKYVSGQFDSEIWELTREDWLKQQKQCRHRHESR